MVKRKKNYRLTSDHTPVVTNVDFPIFVPNEKGQADLVVGKGRLRYGTLVIEMKDTAVSVAIQKSIERGSLIGLGFVMVDPDDTNLEYQDVVEKEEAADAARKEAELTEESDNVVVGTD